MRDGAVRIFRKRQEEEQDDLRSVDGHRVTVLSCCDTIGGQDVYRVKSLTSGEKFEAFEEELYST
jgi:hypothetical protein